MHGLHAVSKMMYHMEMQDYGVTQGHCVPAQRSAVLATVHHGLIPCGCSCLHKRVVSCEAHNPSQRLQGAIPGPLCHNSAQCPGKLGLPGLV